MQLKHVLLRPTAGHFPRSSHATIVILVMAIIMGLKRPIALLEAESRLLVRLCLSLCVVLHAYILEVPPAVVDVSI